MHFFVIKRQSIYILGILIFAMLCVYVNGADAVKTMTAKENVPIYCVQTEEKILIPVDYLRQIKAGKLQLLDCSMV